MTVRFSDLVVPLPHEGTDKRMMDTAGRVRGRSSAVSPLTVASRRPSDVDSTNGRSMSRTATMPGRRTSTTATRTTTTRTTSFAPVPSADESHDSHADFSFEELVVAYFDCCRSKRNSASALAFEINLERNLCDLYDDIASGRYAPGRSVCFVITRPKPREVWAAQFRDRIVHHLLYNRISPSVHSTFIADSCACIPGRGTLYAAERLEAKVRSQTQNWSRPGHYLKCDLANFFVSIDKHVMSSLLDRHIREPWWRQLADMILWHDPRLDYEYRGDTRLLERVPHHKKLTSQSSHLGLPIGNLSSQFFANIYLDVLDQFVKHRLRARHYIRYVDDLVLLHESPQWLNEALAAITDFLPNRLHVDLNPTKTVLQPIDRGIDFAGQLIKPWRRTVRKRTRNEALRRATQIQPYGARETINSYFGLFRQASHSHADRVRLARLALARGHCVDFNLTKALPKSPAPQKDRYPIASRSMQQQRATHGADACVNQLTGPSANPAARVIQTSNCRGCTESEHMQHGGSDDSR
ncbi:MAG: reverse transcriptase domain-containing protein [Bradyrhizobium sp.]|uniref:RNA-directed DNA polymerase n=1 Tax=Bradyrhizobium sp. TaxID=376 RepID=UPI003D0F2111